MSRGQCRRGWILKDDLEGDRILRDGMADGLIDKSLRDAARDVRYLLDRGYPKESSITFVSDHHRLPLVQRFVLSRVVLPSDLACSRREKIVVAEGLRGRELYIDGYNVIITVESLLGSKPVYLCDDGFLRDAEGVFRHYRPSDITCAALSEIFGVVADYGPSNVTVLLDEQLSKSGELAAFIRRTMEDRSLQGTAKTARDVDFQLKASTGPVATADGSIVDSVLEAVDIPSDVARRRSIQLRVL